MTSALRPPLRTFPQGLLRPALFLVASGLLPFVVSITLALIQWWTWHCVGGRSFDTDLGALLTVFGAALGFELLLTLLVFHPRPLGRIVLMTIGAISVPLLVAIEVLDYLDISDLFLEAFLPLAIWTAVAACLTIVIPARLVTVPSSKQH